MSRRLMVAALTVAFASTGAHTFSGVDGRWNMTVKGPAAHGNMTATMQLRQDGKQVTGTLTAHGSEHTLAGDFADSTLTVETTDTPAGSGMSLTAKLKDDGTLAGYLSSPMGDMQWTAVLAKGSH